MKTNSRRDEQISGPERGRGGCYDVHDHGEKGWQRDMQEPFTGLVRMPGIRDTGYDCNYVGRCSQQQSRHTVISKASDNADDEN